MKTEEDTEIAEHSKTNQLVQWTVEQQLGNQRAVSGKSVHGQLDYTEMSFACLQHAL